ncbi:MAG: bifunctional diaminohydroxyphosphoribosylaminopyrimidine deaminase/5-amino-6-(5-phosphoribosylamino)uracil reductase RibD [Rubrobacteraceae bacterium]
MGRARELAERGRYTAAPNPLVGAVISLGGRVIGEGWHERAGGDHAEVSALKSCKTTPRGATMYVSLEPCNHHGRTPPCTETIIQAGIGRVVVGHLDPNPSMRGRSVEVLREAGIEVEVLEESSFERQNERFFHRMRTGLPFVHLKLAATLDGRIAASGGDSKWITGEKARLRAHLLRAEAGAVLVGATTATTDDPLLTARGVPGEPPRTTRVVLDPHLKLGPRSRLLMTADESPVIIFTTEEAGDDRGQSLERAGAEVISVPATNEGLDLSIVLEELARRDISGVLVEGGGETARRFVERGLVNKLTLFYAPKLLGSNGVPMMGALEVSRVAEAPKFSVDNLEMVGDDVAVTLYPREPGRR